MTVLGGLGKLTCVAAREPGLSVLTNHIHVNDRAAGAVAELIGGVLGDA